MVSIDTEMAWGSNHRPEVEYHYPRERAHIDRLLLLFDRYRIPATWAVVGHLMLDGCAPVDGVKHPEIVRPDPARLGDWFRNDPCTAATPDSTWYAPGLVQRILNAGVDHEIASHGFSHIPAGDPGCSRACFESEVVAALAVAAEQGLELRTFIHPRNSIGHLDVLVEHGFTAYRGRSSRSAPLDGGLSRLAAGVIDKAVGSHRTTVRPQPEGPLWNLPATILFDVEARPRLWPLWLAQVERRLAQAIRHRSLFHLWFHPHNLRDNPEVAFAALERICRIVAARRRQGVLDTLTMGDLAVGLAGGSSRPRRERAVPLLV